MAIRFKGDILGQLKAKGYSTSKLRKEGIFGERTMQIFRHNGELPYKSINRLCSLLGCQPGDVLEYVPDVPEYRKSADSDTILPGFFDDSDGCAIIGESDAPAN